MLNLSRVATILGRLPAPVLASMLPDEDPSTRQKVLRLTGDPSRDPTRVNKAQECLLGNHSAFVFFRTIALNVVNSTDYRKHNRTAEAIMLHSANDLSANLGVRYPAYVAALLDVVDANYCKGSHTRAYRFKPAVFDYLLSTKAALRQYKANQERLTKVAAPGLYRETYCLSSLLAACTSPKLSEDSRASAIALLAATAHDDEGNIAHQDIKYMASNEHNVGRIYTGTMGIQRMSKELRAFILRGAASMDVKNSLPSILNSLSTGQFKALNDYCGNRQAHLDTIVDECGTDRKAAKAIILAVIHGASVKRAAAQNPESAFGEFLATCSNEAAVKAAKAGRRIAHGAVFAFLDALSTDMRAAARWVANNCGEKYADLWNVCAVRAQEANPGRPMWRLDGPTIGLFLQSIERAYMDRVEAKLAEHGLVVSARVHDEVFVQFAPTASADAMRATLSAVIAVITVELAQETGISLEFDITTYTGGQ
jgi:hypothetical protein